MSATLPLLNEPTSPPAAPLPGILDVPAEGLRAWLAERRQPPMRVNQIRRQILANRAESFEAMSDLPKDLRADLAASFSVFSTRVERHLFAQSDDTHKLVLRLADDRMIECVLIQDDGRATACVSTQVGCGMGCVFCASGLNGVVRNLTVGEIVEQLVRLRNLTDPTTTNPDRAPRLTHIVVMGMGEPLANLDRLLEALAIAGDKNGLCIGQRHVTISTVGLPAKIRQLAEAGKQYHLAVSLHAPNDALRTQIVPTNDKTGIPAILDAADDFYARTGRQVTYEYVVLGGLNDGPTHAKELARLLSGRKAHVNLIPWNDVDGLPYRRPVEGNLQGFVDTLRHSGVSVKVRKRKGTEIDAACGQLRRKVEQEAAAGREPAPAAATAPPDPVPAAAAP
ncbi:50s rrna methyltransferase : Probable dual-specificity RNA methyltransferase RlmN OS=Singulisphaera acidiphila (strain ATCC BAA-1392 / DSM 18658 / VKM B-2454 / MOB10) GN=rlmN PE=3 SV=1: Radical_SAM [Gemmataceae bacterium]|nr:50s rrna methyltransferase : Probable dual-specificity RNA methyltransferase RlmN OS=Singulisphaera acidiphila (strain ATCC BAA-1392 / DSM 18658 / VKM B-2454 / MOB10) GN=rlmN PE=3 SV=1: Radical_SAM [Gemmataceae bacterium]VTT98274.1 50s rrna methyltransferase : Probable dual-specificity RNA methyltransferase RlmN OS=Singulisphaera acidiphila (strain ATCC BAA-1392 / DSM 18658 / VKM B-2454 / MOB10) GN=rlmN PE=3 SV=1: Radical_SAM [Gemmataceae bacterium]